MTGMKRLAALFLLGSACACLAAQEGAAPAPIASTEAQSTDAAPAAAPSPAPAQKKGLELTGRSWADVSLIAPFGSAYGPDDIAYAAAVATRLNLLNAKRDVIKFEASLDAGLLYGAAAKAQRTALLGALAGSPAAVLLLPGLSGNDFSGVSLEIKKLSLGLDLGAVDIVVGRQIFNSGRALVFSPADLFSSPDLSGLQAGRNGSDLARLSLALGERSGLIGVAKPGIDPARGDYALRAYSGIKDFDAALQGARRMGAAEGSGSWSLAADFKADLILGVYGEASLALSDSGERDLRACAGADYSIERTLFLRAEYYYNGRAEGATADPSDPLAAFPEAQYLYAGLNWLPTDELSLGAYWYGALGLAIGSGTASVSYLAAQNAQLTGFFRVSYDDPLTLQIGARMEVKF
jgi:hypothetical protein